MAAAAADVPQPQHQPNLYLPPCVVTFLSTSRLRRTSRGAVNRGQTKTYFKTRTPESNARQMGLARPTISVGPPERPALVFKTRFEIGLPGRASHVVSTRAESKMATHCTVKPGLKHRPCDDASTSPYLLPMVLCTLCFTSSVRGFSAELKAT